MKFLTTVAICSSLALAAPAPNPEPWCTNPAQGCWKREAAPAPWCTNPGQGCWKTKRDVEAEKRWCTNPGQGCWKVKRAADAFAEGVKARGLPAESDASTGYPYIAVGDLPSFNHLASFLAHASGDHKAFIETVTPEADKRWCTNPGQGCWKKREAEPEAEAEEKRWCLFPGQGCWKAKRDDAAVEEGLTAEKRWCARVPEAACNAVREVTRSVLDTVGEQASETEEEKRWCTNPGQGCWKAKRDLATIREYASGILANLE